MRCSAGAYTHAKTVSDLDFRAQTEQQKLVGNAEVSKLDASLEGQLDIAGHGPDKSSQDAQSRDTQQLSMES